MATFRSLVRAITQGLHRKQLFAWLLAASTVLDATGKNVLAFGAVGDGVHDDTAAIQAAIDAAGVLGGAVIGTGAGIEFGVAATGLTAIPASIVLANITNTGSIVGWVGAS